MPAAGDGRARVATRPAERPRRSRWQRYRYNDRARPEGHRDQEAEAVGFLRDEPGLLSHAARLRQRDLVGTTTSGCVRTTVVDALSLNYRVILAEEGCFDRSEASHAVSLCDMHAKYADVVPTDEVVTYFATLPAGLFDLPSGISAAAPVRAAAE